MTGMHREIAHRAAIATPIPLLLLALVAAPVRAVDGLNDSGGKGDVYFDVGGGYTDLGYACAAQSDGKVLLAGTVTTDDSEGHQIGVARLELDGDADPAFGPGAPLPAGVMVIDLSSTGLGIFGKEAQARAMTIDKQGRIYVGGFMFEGDNAHNGFYNRNVGIVIRLDATGAVDLAWQSGIYNGVSIAGAMSRVVAMGFNTDGHLWVVGPEKDDGTGEWRYERLDSGGYEVDSGGFDFSFWGPDTSAPTAMAMEPDGNVIIGGYIQRGSPSYLGSVALARVRGSDLMLDPTYGVNASGQEVFDYPESSYLRSVALQPDLRIVYAAETGPLNQEHVSVENLDRNGTFGTAWEQPVAFPLGNTSASGGGGQNRMVVQSDGKVVVGAISYNGNPPLATNITDVGVARLTGYGAFDLGFGGNGTGKAVYDMPPVGTPGSDGNDQLTCMTLSAGKPVLVGSGHANSFADWDYSYLRLTNDLIFTDGFAAGSTFFWSDQSP